MNVTVYRVLPNGTVSQMILIFASGRPLVSFDLGGIADASISISQLTVIDGLQIWLTPSRMSNANRFAAITVLTLPTFHPPNDGELKAHISLSLPTFWILPEKIPRSGSLMYWIFRLPSQYILLYRIPPFSVEVLGDTSPGLCRFSPPISWTNVHAWLFFEIMFRLEFLCLSRFEKLHMRGMRGKFHEGNLIYFSNISLGAARRL